jgi:hypothetical protein
MDDDTLTRGISPSDILKDLRQNPSSFKRAATPETAAPPPMPEVGGDPAPESYDPKRKSYRAFGHNPGNRTLPSLTLVLKDGSQRAFPNAHLDSHYPGGCEFIPSAPGRGNVIRLRYAGANVSFMVELEGRNLHRVWELIMAHTTPFVVEYPADMDVLGEDEAVIKAIRFDVLK